MNQPACLYKNLARVQHHIYGLGTVISATFVDEPSGGYWRYHLRVDTPPAYSAFPSDRDHYCAEWQIELPDAITRLGDIVE